MVIRVAAAICLVALLSACGASSSLGRRDYPAAATGLGMVTPGQIGDDECGWNVGNTIYFETDGAVLIPEAQIYLQKQAAWLICFPQHTVTIEGHADERGTREYNLALGERRAQAVMNYLVALGVDQKRIKTISYGKERPICTDANNTCWSQNRRTVTILDN